MCATLDQGARRPTPSRRPPDQQIPLIGPLAEVAAGTPIVCDANTVERMPAAIADRFRPRPDYLLTVRGNSMNRTRIVAAEVIEHVEDSLELSAPSSGRAAATRPLYTE